MMEIYCDSNRGGANCEGIDRGGERRGWWRFVVRVIGMGRTVRI